jgi:two-component system LytT family sensor kinase
MATSTFRRIATTQIILFVISVTAYFIRWLSGQFSAQLNLILFIVLFIVLSISWELIRWVHHRLNVIFPFEKNLTARISIQMAIGGILALTIRFLIYKFGEPYLPEKLDSLFLASTWAIYTMGVAGLNTIFFIKYFISRWKDSLVQAQRLEKEKSQVQFDNLKNQLNPHFLFNALTSLNTLITENPTLASQFLQQMSKVYRYVLQNRDKNFVSLQTELDFIGHYVFLAETRFADALKIKFTIDDSAKDKAIVPVTLQILIENSMKHNIIELQRPLTIEIFTSGDYLVVSNNLQQRKIVETSNKMGLENLKSLYSFLTDRPVIIAQDLKCFSVKVPLI